MASTSDAPTRLHSRVTPSRFLTIALAVRCDAYRRLAPLHAVEAAGRLGRPELLDEGLRELELRLANERARYELG